jgi:sodium transport system permease protein
VTPFSALLRHELRLLARDTRMIFIAVVLPLVLFPVLILVLRAVEQGESERLDSALYRYAVRDTAQDQDLAHLVERALALPGDRPGARFDRDRTPTPDSALATGDIQLVAEWSAADTARGDTLLHRPGLTLRYRADSDLSRAAATELEARLLSLGSQERDSVFRAAGFPTDTDRVFELEATNVATPAREGGARLGLLLTPLVLLLLLTGGSIAAVDTLSGEKERGTLETLLTTGLTRAEIIRAKLLAIVALGLVLVTVNAANLVTYLVIGVLELPAGLALSVAPLDALLVLLLLAPLTVLVAGSLLFLSGRVDGYKDFQIAFFPVMLAFVALAAPSVLPGMELRSAIAVVPVAGLGVAVREVMVGERDWLFLALAWLSSGGAAYLLTRLAERGLSTERLIGGATLSEHEARGGPALFPYRVARWFAVLWALFFTVSLWFGDALGMRGQVVVNLIVLFSGATWLMIRRYRLDIRKALSLRPPPLRTWLAVVLGAPAGYVTAIGLAGLVDAYLFPVPQGMLEAFGETMLVETISVWQLLLFLAVMPAIAEELAFRGVLLHGLRARMRPVAAILLAGAVFGLFHVSLFRIVPTAYLGVILAATVVLTGSIYPAIIWHFLNNALAIVPVRMGWIDTSTDLPWWIYAAAVVTLAVSLAIMVSARRGAGPDTGSADVEAPLQGRTT